MIHEIFDVDLRFMPGDWPFAVERGDEIAAYWQECMQAQPALWDGQTLLSHGVNISDGVLSGSVTTTSFSSFIAWRDWGFPDKDYFNCFGSAALLSKEGWLVFGVMGAHTANAGHIYPPGGSLEPSDLSADGSANIFASIARELMEETGLRFDDATEQMRLAIFDEQRVSVASVLRFDLPMETLAAKIEQHIASEENPELAGIFVIREAADIDRSNCVPYAIELAEYLLEGNSQGF